MIPLSALGGGGRPPGPSSMPPGGGGGSSGMIPLGALGSAGNSGGMIPLGALGGSGSTGVSMDFSATDRGMSGGLPPSMVPPDMMPPSFTPPSGPLTSGSTAGAAGGSSGSAGAALPDAAATPSSLKPGEGDNDDRNDTLAEVGKTAKDYLDVLMPIVVPSEEDSRPAPKQVACLEDGTNLFKMFDVDMHRFDPKAAKKQFHRLSQYVAPERLGREPTAADKARYTKLKQAFAVTMDEQLRGVYRQHCFGIAGSGGLPAQGHDSALTKALELGRELRKMGEERAIVLHKAAETGWSERQKDQDGRLMRADGRKLPHQFNLFVDVSSSEDGEAELEKERRGLTPQQILDKSPRYADAFLDKVQGILMDPKVSKIAAGGAFTMLEEPKLGEMLNENPRSVQRLLRRIRTAVKQMNWAMTALLQVKESPWRGLEVKGSLVEHGVVKLLEILKSGIAFGKFSELHEEEFGKLIDNMHRLYMDLFERRGQELLRSAIAIEATIVYLLPESEGRLPDGTRVTLKELGSRPDLNGKGGLVAGWDYSLQRYTVELEKEEAKKDSTKQAPMNPDLLAVGDFDDDEDVAEPEDEEDKPQLAVPKKLMLMPKNAQVDLSPARTKLEGILKNWNMWRKRPRSVSATQDAEAVAAALGPPLESMAGYLQEASSAVSTAATCPDGADLVADECREALQGARNLAAKLLGEEPQEPPPPPPMAEPPAQLVIAQPMDEATRILKEAAEVAAAGIQIKQTNKKKKRSRSRSKRRRRRSTSSSSRSDSYRPHRKPKYA